MKVTVEISPEEVATIFKEVSMGSSDAMANVANQVMSNVQTSMINTWTEMMSKGVFYGSASREAKSD